MSVDQVMVVEDDPTIASEVRDALLAHGYDVRSAPDGRSAVDLLRASLPDLVVLDLGLPDFDGVQLCRRMRAEYAQLPIVIVTARDTDLDIVVGLDAGATDYVTKPFSMTVLLARLRAHLRESPAGGVDAVIVVGDLRVDGGAHRAYLSDSELDLRPKEFALLHLMAGEAGKVITRDRLLGDLWDLHWESSTKTLDMHIHALRRKLGERANGTPWISTVRTVGYRFELA